MRRRIISLAAAAATALAGAAAITVGTAAPAAADSCYTWDDTLRSGDSGSAVEQLQIRVAGWMETGEHLAIDGEYGPATEAAVKRFQSGYGLEATGVAGSETFEQIYELQSSDCTPAHFEYSEFDENCGAHNFDGGKVSASEAQERTKRVMWQLEAMRHKLDDTPLGVSSGIRSVSCNESVGGSSSSRHMYGDAADLGNAANSVAHCTLFAEARKAGFTEVLGAGYPGHNDHVHVANGTGTVHRAPNC